MRGTTVLMFPGWPTEKPCQAGTYLVLFVAALGLWLQSRLGLRTLVADGRGVGLMSAVDSVPWYSV